jgi:hypothetical protein
MQLTGLGMNCYKLKGILAAVNVKLGIVGSSRNVGMQRDEIGSELMPKAMSVVS